MKKITNLIIIFISLIIIQTNVVFADVGSFEDYSSGWDSDSSWSSDSWSRI